jgi:hypothetical protein
MDKIYYDGDSFSWLGVKKNTGHFLAEKLNLELKHYGFSKKTYEQTIRSVMRYTFQPNAHDTFFCIGIGVANRLDAYSDIPTPIQHYKYQYWEEERYTHMVCAFDATTHHNNEIFLDQTENDFIRTKILFSLVTLHDYLLHNGYKFIIHNLDINYRLHRSRKFSKDIVEQVNSRPRIVNFFENSLHDLMYAKKIRGFDYDQYGTMAHPGEDGHQMYAEFLTPYVEKYIN